MRPPSFLDCQSSGAVWKSRWPSWAPVPNKPTVSVDVKQHFNNNILERLSLSLFNPCCDCPKACCPPTQTESVLSSAHPHAPENHHFSCRGKASCGITLGTVMDSTRNRFTHCCFFPHPYLWVKPCAHLAGQSIILPFLSILKHKGQISNILCAHTYIHTPSTHIHTLNDKHTGFI